MCPLLSWFNFTERALDWDGSRPEKGDMVLRTDETFDEFSVLYTQVGSR